MRVDFLVSLVTGLLFVCVQSVAAAPVPIYVDSAPNVYGSPDYPGWQENAFTAVAAGTFINMSNGINAGNIGTTNFEIQDEVVYSFGDLGKRLHWMFFIEGETVAGLEGTNRFQISLTNIWDGAVLDFYDYYYGNTWLEPANWVDYDADNDGVIDGVMGTAGMAWWGAYGVNTQAALDADMAAWALSEEYWVFTARFDGDESSLTSYRAAVPEPATLILFSAGLAGLMGARIRRNKRAH
jgi:hypothetical protein